MTPLPVRETCPTDTDINDPSRTRIVIRAPTRRANSTSTTKGRISLRSLKKQSSDPPPIPESPPEASSSSTEPKEIRGVKVLEGRVAKASKYERSSSVSSSGSSRTSNGVYPLTAYAAARQSCRCRQEGPAAACRRCRLLRLADHLCTIVEGGYVKSPLVH